MSSFSSRSALGVAALALSLATPAAALAGPGGCTQLPTSKSFASVDGDAADYSPAPGGDFEVGSAAWTLRGGARVVAGNENLNVSPGKRALVIPVAGSATSPLFCVDETNPHFRFAYKIDSIGLTGFVARVTYTAPSGVKSIRLFSSQEVSITPSKWQASPKSPLATLLPLRGGTATVQIQIVGVTVAGANIATQVMGGGFATMASPLANLGVTIDSVMVDPYRRS